MEKSRRQVNPFAWKLEKEPEGVVRVTPGLGRRFFEALFLLAVGLLFTGALLAALWGEQAETMERFRKGDGGFLIGVVWVLGVGGALVFYGFWNTAGREYWRVGDNFFEIGRVFFGRTVSRRYLGGTFVLRDFTGGREGGRWQLGLRRKRKPRELAVNGDLETALELGQLLTRYSGWPLVLSLWNADGLVLNLRARRYWRSRDPLYLTNAEEGSFAEFTGLRLWAAPPRDPQERNARPKRLVLSLDWQDPRRRPSDIFCILEPRPQQWEAACRQARTLAEMLGLPLVEEAVPTIPKKG